MTKRESGGGIEEPKSKSFARQEGRGLGLDLSGDGKNKKVTGKNWR